MEYLKLTTDINFVPYENNTSYPPSNTELMNKINELITYIKELEERLTYTPYIGDC